MHHHQSNQKLTQSETETTEQIKRSTNNLVGKNALTLKYGQMNSSKIQTFGIGSMWVFSSASIFLSKKRSS